jgi:uncharacterized protein YaiI (UPF0178 family)
MPGSHAYNLPDAADQWVSRNATPEEIALSKLDPTATLNVVKRAMATEEEKQAVEDYQTDYRVFLKMYPAYKDNAHNAQLMKHHWQTVFGVSVPSLPQIEETFFALRNSGVLHLNAAAVAKEDAAAIAQRADKIIADRKAAEFNEADAYAMPFEELEGRVRGWK